MNKIRNFNKQVSLGKINGSYDEESESEEEGERGGSCTSRSKEFDGTISYEHQN